MWTRLSYVASYVWYLYLTYLSVRPYIFVLVHLSYLALWKTVIVQYVQILCLNKFTSWKHCKKKKFKKKQKQISLKKNFVISSIRFYMFFSTKFNY